MKITVVTCVYNLIISGREDSFRQTVESVHNQTHEDIEHIIIYTPSADKTDLLVNEYVQKGWVKCFEFKQKGIWNAMQEGIRVASGDYINFLNSDDYFIDENTVSKVVKSIQESDAEWTFADAVILYSSKGSKPVSTIMKSDISQAPFSWSVHHQTMFVSMNVMREIGGFDLSYDISLDNHMIIKLLLMKKKYAYIEEPLIVYSANGWSSTNSPNAIREDYAINFYDQIGKDFGMSLSECRDLWLFGASSNRSCFYYKRLANKISIKEWRETFLDYSMKECIKRGIKQKVIKSIRAIIYQMDMMF